METLKGGRRASASLVDLAELGENAEFRHLRRSMLSYVLSERSNHPLMTRSAGSSSATANRLVGDCYLVCLYGAQAAVFGWVFCCGPAPTRTEIESVRPQPSMPAGSAHPRQVL